MLAALADSIAAFSLRLPFGSPPPCRAATVISRRIFEKSFPRWTSVLPFLRLICDHRECPDMSLTIPLDRRLDSFDTRQTPRAPLHRLLPPAVLGRCRRLVRRARPRPQIVAQVDERQIRRARVAQLARPRHLRQHL